MENKNKIEESLKRFKELISEDNLYGNLVNKELLNEGGGLLSIVDDIIKKIEIKTKVIVDNSVLDLIDTNAKTLFKNKLNLPSMQSSIGFKNYIKSTGTNGLSNDLKKVLMNSINRRNNNINNNETLKDAYVKIVDEYIEVFDKYKKDLAEGAYTVESLQSKPELNRLLSLVDDGEGKTFYSKYKQYFKRSIPDDSILTRKLPPVAQKIWSDIWRGLDKPTKFIKSIKGINEDKPLVFKSLTQIYENIAKQPTWKKKTWAIMKTPISMYSSNFWKLYIPSIAVKWWVLSSYCDRKRETSGDVTVENYHNFINDDIVIVEAEETKDAWYWAGKLGSAAKYLAYTMGKYFLKFGIADPASVVPGFGLWDWRCGDVSNLFVEDLTEYLGDPDFLNAKFKTSDGVVTGQEIKDGIENAILNFDLNGIYENIVSSTKKIEEKLKD
jgi:hypothetical protein